MFEGTSKNLQTLQPIQIQDNFLNDSVLLDLLTQYLVLSNYFFYENNFYRKLPETSNSFELIESCTTYFLTKFWEIVDFFKKNFPCNFFQLDFYYLYKKELKVIDKVMARVKNITKCRIVIRADLIEFRDGIYCFSSNTLLSKNLIPKWIGTTSFISKSFKYIKDTQNI